jgi:ubiquitin-like-conjugating enzyme ATG3
MHKIKNEIHKAYRGVAEKVLGDMTESAFLAKGQLTPDEFVLAGNALVGKCPTWSWEGGDESKANKSLPLDKQFLLIHDVPCRLRAKDLLDDEKNHIEEKEDEDGWVVAESKIKQEIVEIDKEDKKEAKQDHNDEIVDIEDELDSSDEDEAGKNIFANPKKEKVEEEKKGEDEDGVMKVRRYNISLTYDKYYATPRLWLQGYDETKQPLDKQMFEDVMAEHAKKTVTIEKHNHLDGPKQATIHP